MKRKLFAVMTSLCLLVAAFPLSVFADDAQYQEVDVDGSVSTDLNYSFEYVPQGNEFVISIPTSLSWAGVYFVKRKSLKSEKLFPVFGMGIPHNRKDHVSSGCTAV